MNTYLARFKSSFKRAKDHGNSLDATQSIMYLSEIDSDIFTCSTSTTKSSRFRIKNPFGFIDRKIKRQIAKVQTEEDELSKQHFINILTCGHELHPYYRELLTKLAFDGYQMKEEVVKEYYDEVVNGPCRGIWLDGEDRSIEYCGKKHKCCKLFRKMGYSVSF
ncbi:hypothetical protein CANARDRAFT_9729 [[Candida] arabinofermentans NRRL YB-2248]|uniref:Uncharacterized protein n=1 Tax=[Candida] arabinofermentans NRRL YB-2248 TaxID=983967 RepID=A0A1E4SV72_9ASCO|nr:hypothetical protein CANARDRAFT_9729 [[Candida] arabinofermentans NRRL YB-2248]